MGPRLIHETDGRRKSSQRGESSKVAYPSRIPVQAKLEETTSEETVEKDGPSLLLPSRMESRLSASLGGGQVLSGPLRSQMEGAFGQSFSNVRLHTDSVASEMSQSIGAKAFTYGNDIFFNQGQFQPQSSAGRHLIAHELTHTVQQSGKVSMAPLPESPNQIRVTDKDTHPGKKSEESALMEDIQQKMNGYTRNQVEIKKGDAQGIGRIENVLADCDGLLGYARSLKQQSQFFRSGSQWGQNPLLNKIVQQLYNTLSQVSVAMDILPKPKPANNDLGSLAKTPWVRCRNKFNSVVKGLATLAHNPAIAVLIYEGTYYPTQYSSKTLKATRKAVGDSKNGEIDSSYLLYYGAVCNNAAYGSVFAAGTAYQSASGDGAQPVLGLSRGDRAPWSTYNLQGTGVGNDAMEGARQGDIMIFWHFSKLDDSTIAGREKQHHRDIKKELAGVQGALKEARKAAEKESNDWLERGELMDKIYQLELEEADYHGTDRYISELFGQLRDVKTDFGKIEKSLSSSTRAKNKAESAAEKARSALKLASDAFKKAVKQLQDAKTEKAKKTAKDNLRRKSDAFVKAIRAKQEAETNLAKERGNYDKISKEYGQTKDQYANLIVSAALNAQHTEVVVGVDDDAKRYLLSGAHGSNFVNGIARDKGKLAWKSAEEIRGTRIMRRIPMNNEADLIPVNIPSVMEKQGYDVSKVSQKRQEEQNNLQEGELESEFANGSYDTKTGKVPVYYNSNKSDSVVIQWLAKSYSSFSG